MALRKRGKSGFWHAYFRAVLSNEDGTLRYVMRTVNLYTDDLITARAKEAEVMRKAKTARYHQRAEAARIRMDIEAGLRPVCDMPSAPERRRRVKRLAIADALSAAEKYHAIGETTRKRFRAFARDIGVKWMDDVTPDMAFEYLSGKEDGSGKNFNNIKSALNNVFRLTLLDSGMDASPFAKIPSRAVHSEHQRPFTLEEFKKIMKSAPEPWKSAAMVAWFTGLREKDVFTLRWEQIKEDVLTTVPAKTARFGRAVRIPLHPQLAEYLASLPRNGERVLGAWSYSPESSRFRNAFGSILDELGITSNECGIVVFNSLRDSFVTRCDEAGIPRHAVRGIVGHVKDDQTDLYSHDLATARMVQRLPRVKLS